MRIGGSRKNGVLAGWRLAAASVVACFLTVGVQPAWAQQNRHRKLDKQLNEQLEKVERGAVTDAPVKVIVTLKPEARKGLNQKVRARGGRHRGDFSVINGGAAELTATGLRQLADDDDVLNISVDADVHSDGVASSLTGAPQNGGFSLKSALGLRAPSAFTTTTSFQRGNLNAYAGVSDTGVDVSSPGANLSGWSTNWIEGFGNIPAGVLLKFDNIFGTGVGQIPPGSTITSVSLRIRQTSGASSTASLKLHRMLQPWDNATTWNSMTASGTGVQFDNVEVATNADATITNLSTSGYKTFTGAGLTAAVQAWANGQVNNGWMIWETESWAFTINTSEDATLAYRPLLTVTYKAPVTTTSLTGNGVTVAVIDSGLLEDGGTTSRIKTTRDFTTGPTNPAHIAPVDGYGHGTHIAGLIGGNKAEVEGVAPGVKFVSLKVLNSAGVGSTSNVISAIQWAIANKAAYGIDILNLSLGHPILEPAATDPLVQAVEAASRAGITVVVAAGNMGINPATGQVGYAGIGSPANAPSAITVGSSRTMNTTTRQDDLVSDFSSRGPTWYDAFEKPDVVAPGQYLLGPAVSTQALYASVPALRGPSFGGRSYMYMSGTSMAAGVVSGSVALMIEQARLSFWTRPTTNAIKAMLQRSAIPLANASGVRYDRLTQGAGSLNPMGGINLAAALNPNATLGWNWVSNTIPLTTTIDGQVIGWNDNIVWGTSVLYGDALNTRLNAWSDNIVWGTNDNIVWGTSLPAYSAQDNIVWGTSATWLDNIVWGTSDNIVWGTSADNIVWGTLDNIVWGTSDNIVWGTNDNIVWGTNDNIVWGTSALVTPVP